MIKVNYAQGSCSIGGKQVECSLDTGDGPGDAPSLPTGLEFTLDIASPHREVLPWHARLLDLWHRTQLAKSIGHSKRSRRRHRRLIKALLSRPPAPLVTISAGHGIAHPPSVIELQSPAN